jgi:hypothetical protein
MTRYPGEVYYLPPEAAADGDPKHRPHVLLSTCNDSAETATLAYCSTQATDAAFGAAHVLVNPAASKYRLTGLREATYVYPSRLTICDVEDLGDLAGRIIDEVPDIRLKLVQALGIGTGSCIGAGAAAGHCVDPSSCCSRTLLRQSARRTPSSSPNRTTRWSDASSM